MTEMSKTEIATRFLAAEYGGRVPAEVLAETVAEMSAEELDAIVAAVAADPHLAG